jgi:hypothetical protein
VTPLVEGVWLDTGPVRIVGMNLTSTMTVLKLPDRGLLLHAPIAFTPERRAAVQALGTVTHLYAPNTFHHLHVGEWAAAFPAARVHGPAGLRRKRPDLRIDRAPPQPLDASLADVLTELPIDGFRLEERVLLYRPARTLVVADLVHNVGRPQQPWAQVYTRLMGFHDRVAVSRVLRLAFTDRAAARRSLDAVLALPFDRLVVGHGTPLQAGAKAALAAAYSWLPAAR